MTTLTLDQANQIITAALAASKQAGYQPMGIAVLDEAGHLKAFAREDGASMFRFDVAQAKAWGAVGMGVSSRTLGERAKGNPNFFVSLAATVERPLPAADRRRADQGRARRGARRRRCERRHRRRGRGHLHGRRQGGGPGARLNVRRGRLTPATSRSPPRSAPAADAPRAGRRRTAAASAAARRSARSPASSRRRPGSPACALMPAFMRATMGAGVPAGATTASQPTMSKPGNVSASAGTLSQPAMRLGEVTASMRSRPWLHQLRGRRDVGHQRIRLPADQVLHARADRAVGHEIGAGLGARVEQPRDHAAEGARAFVGERQLARLGLAARDEVVPPT